MQYRKHNQLFRHFGVGAGYRFLQLDVDADRGDWKGSIELGYHGPYLFVPGNF